MRNTEADRLNTLEEKDKFGYYLERLHIMQ